jgi:uncharacterized membrane protein YdjX (TVP38/TMEM64 family)
MKKIDIIKFIIFLVILIVSVWTVNHFHLMHRVMLLRGWIQASGVPGALLFIAAFAVAFSFGVPAIALTVFAGTLFGTFTGLAAASAGATLGIIITFYLSRFLARDMIQDALGKNPTFVKIDALTEKYGWYMVAIIRFIPFIPAELVNYCFGLTKIKSLPYIFWSWLCMLPWLFIYIAGTGAYIDYREDKTLPWVLIIPSVLMLVLLIFTAVNFMKLIEPELKKKSK